MSVSFTDDAYGSKTYGLGDRITRERNSFVNKSPGLVDSTLDLVDYIPGSVDSPLGLEDCTLSLENCTSGFRLKILRTGASFHLC